MNNQVADVLSSVPIVIFPLSRRVNDGVDAAVMTQRHFETLGQHLQDGVAFTDAEGRILYWNDAMAELTEMSASDCVGTRWDFAGLHFITAAQGESEERFASQQCPVAVCLDREMAVIRTMKIIVREPCEHREVRVHKHADRRITKPAARDVLVRITPVGAEHGGGAVVIVRDLSDHVEMQSQIVSLHKKATRDPLTGVANRSEFDQCLMRCTSEAQQRPATFSLIMCDIDHFKRINDVHGHPAGDEALIQFASVLTRHTRSSDLVARYGGEEFVVVAANSDQVTAMRRANEIRQAVATTPLQGLGGQSVTISIGVTEYLLGDTPESIVARADRALRRAKAQGRNRVE